MTPTAESDSPMLTMQEPPGCVCFLMCCQASACAQRQAVFRCHFNPPDSLMLSRWACRIHGCAVPLIYRLVQVAAPAALTVALKMSFFSLTLEGCEL